MFTVAFSIVVREGDEPEGSIAPWRDWPSSPRCPLVVLDVGRLTVLDPGRTSSRRRR
jgi:hypothetical protein